MFNKPTLFPKSPEPQSVRSGRLVPGGPGGSGTAPQESGGPAAREGGSGAGMSASGTASSAASSGGETRNAGEQSGGSRLIVGPEVKLKGAEILDCDTLVVEGRVEATMDSRVIRIAENGAFSGTVGIDVAEIHGNFDGELTARSQLIIHATGRVSGKIRYGKILIEEGGQISGDVKAIDADASASRRTDETAKATAATPTPAVANA